MGRGGNNNLLAKEDLPKTGVVNKFLTSFKKVTTATDKQQALLDYLRSYSLNPRIIISPNFERILPEELITIYPYTWHEEGSGEGFDPGYTYIEGYDLEFDLNRKDEVEETVKDCLSKEIIAHLNPNGAPFTMAGEFKILPTVKTQQQLLEDFKSSKLGKYLVNNNASQEELIAGLAHNLTPKDNQWRIRSKWNNGFRDGFNLFASQRTRFLDPQLINRLENWNAKDEQAIKEIISSTNMNLPDCLEVEIEGDPYADYISGLYLNNEIADQISEKIEAYLRA